MPTYSPSPAPPPPTLRSWKHLSMTSANVFRLSAVSFWSRQQSRQLTDILHWHTDFGWKQANIVPKNPADQTLSSTIMCGEISNKLMDLKQKKVKAQLCL